MRDDQQQAIAAEIARRHLRSECLYDTEHPCVTHEKSLSHWCNPCLLQEAGAPAPAEGWRDISTAPKDGTRLLLGRKQVMSGEMSVCSGHWSSGDSYNLPHWSSLLPGHDWTHWMPLPASPVPSSGGQDTKI